MTATPSMSYDNTETDTATRFPADEFRVSPYILMRFAGLPYDRFQNLKFKDTIACFDIYLSLRDQVDTQRDTLCDTLYDAVGKQERGDTRVQLINIKRDIYNERALADDDIAFLETALSEDFADNTCDYYAAIEKRDSAYDEARETFQTELVQKRRQLQTALQNPDYRKGIQLTSHALHQSLRGYLNADADDLRAKERATEIGAFRYFCRMSAKTSPFARFGPVALAQTAETTHIPQSDMKIGGRANFNLALSAQIADKLGKLPAFQPLLYPYVNPTYYVDDGIIRFIDRRYPQSMDDQLGMNVFQKGRALPLMQQLIQLLEAHQDGTLTLASFIQQVTNSVNSAEQREKVRQFIHRLVESGLIRNHFRVDSRTFDRIPQLKNALNSLNTPDAAAYIDHLEALQQATQHFDEADLNHREDALNTINAETVRLLYGLDTPVQPDKRGNTLMMEDSYIENLRPRIGQDVLQGLADDLHDLLLLLYRRDRAHGLRRAMLHDAFVQAYGEGGTCENVFELAKMYERTLTESIDARPDNHLSQQAAENLQTYMKALTTEPVEGADSTEVVIDPHKIRDLMNEFEELPPRLYSSALHLQLAAHNIDALRDGNYLAVFNQALPGYGHFFTRYCHLFPETAEEDSLAEQLAETLDRYHQEHPDRPEVVEMLSILDNNAQVHPPLTDREMVMTHETSSRPADEQISLNALRIVHDTDTDELHVYTADDTRIEPFYMGFFHSMGLNEVNRLLTEISPSGYQMEGIQPNRHRENFITQMESASSATANNDDDGTYYRHYPRLRYKRIVLQRETWAMDLDSLTGQFTDDTFETFLQVYDWWQSYDLPDEVFIRMQQGGDRLEDIFENNGRKPMIFDVQNLFSVRLLEKKVSQSNARGLVMEEMLPAPNQLFFKQSDESYVTELQIEFNYGGHHD